ncbi:MAG TPA: carbohydrate kinase [Ktedonobacteraceae bacterium]|nr:carbohydrate kinase [Ktedonobacteraceae bacterium]
MSEEVALKYALFVGEMLVDFIPNTADTPDMRCYQPHPGGAVANAAVALARLGGAARFVGKLGQDHFGRQLLKVLQENQVDTRSVTTTAQGNTTLVLVTLQANGQREFLFYRQHTADTLLTVNDLGESTWEDVALLHAGSVSLTVDPARTATLTALEQAHAQGLLVSFDVNVRLTLWNSETELREMLTQISAHVDLLKCSTEEIHYLDPLCSAPLDPADTSRLTTHGQRLLEQGPGLVVITRGELGALLLTSQYTVEVAASPCQVLDTTGAGDAFMGALLYKLMTRDWTRKAQLTALRVQDLLELGKFANRVAGLSCTRYGGISSLPYLIEVE